MTLDVQRRTNGVPAIRSRRRPRDVFDVLTGIVLVGALVVSVLLVVALSLGLVWLITVLVADLARRVGM